MALDEKRLRQSVTRAVELTPPPEPDRLAAIGARLTTAARRRHRAPAWLVTALLAGTGAAAAAAYWGLMDGEERPQTAPVARSSETRAVEGAGSGDGGDSAEAGSRARQAPAGTRRHDEGPEDGNQNPIIYMR